MLRVYTEIAQCLTLSGACKKHGRNPTEKDLGIIEDAAVVVEHDMIEWVGAHDDLPAAYSSVKTIPVDRKVWLPALVECHTHLVYGGSRVKDYAQRCTGKTYADIAKAGGGILSTVKATRETSLDDLVTRAESELAVFLHRGVGALEIKSGYGLTLESEIKMLECVEALQKKTPVVLVPTFMPAHAVPPEFKGKTDAFIDTVAREWIPEVARRKLAVFFDVFVEEGYFSPGQTRTLCEAAKAHGLKIKLHVDQFTDLKGAELAVELNAVSCDHLDNVSAKGIAALAKSDTVAVLAPGASLFVGTHYPPARALLDAGARVALTTDFNPGTCPSHNLPLMMTLGCAQMKMTIPEVIVASTYNAAAALSLDDRFGTIEVGRPFHVWQVDASSYEEIPYRFGEF